MLLGDTLPTPDSAHSPEPMSAKKVKEYLDVVQASLTIAGLIAAAYWFFAQQFDRPTVKLEISSTQRSALSEDSRPTLLSVEVRATNTGKVPVDLKAGSLILNSVLPEPSKNHETISRHLIVPNGMHLAPGESSQVPLETFYVPNGYQTLSAQASFLVPRTILGIRISDKSHYSWVEESLIEIKDESKQSSCGTDSDCINHDKHSSQ